LEHKRFVGMVSSDFAIKSGWADGFLRLNILICHVKPKSGVAVKRLSEEVSTYLEKRLREGRVDRAAWCLYRKWARFYFDFCDKYGHAPRDVGSLEPFLEKLRSKNQSPSQRDQAADAVLLLRLDKASAAKASGEADVGVARGAGMESWQMSSESKHELLQRILRPGVGPEQGLCDQRVVYFLIVNERP